MAAARKTAAAKPLEIPKPTLISPPDVAALQTQKDTLGGLPLNRITSDEECLAVSMYVSNAKAFVARVEEVFEECTGMAFKMHRLLTGLRGTLTANASNHAQIGARMIVEWDAEKKRRAEAARQKELAEAAARQREQEEQAAAEAAARQAALEELDPWDLPAEEPAAEPVFIPEVIPVPATMNIAAPLAGNQHFRALPWKAVVELKDLVLACADRIKRGDDSLLKYLELNQSALNSDAREHGEEISVVIDPCITAVRERTLAG